MIGNDNVSWIQTGARDQIIIDKEYVLIYMKEMWGHIKILKLTLIASARVIHDMLVAPMPLQVLVTEHAPVIVCWQLSLKPAGVIVRYIGHLQTTEVCCNPYGKY